MRAIHRRRFADAARLIQDADLLLFRRAPLSLRSPSSIIGKAIATSGRSDYTHAAKAVWWRCHSPSVLLCVEVREFYGGRAVTLESQVRENPGRIDVYSPQAEVVGDESRVAGKDLLTTRHPSPTTRYSRFGAAAYMLSFTGQRYGYRAIARAAKAYVPLIRWAFETDSDDAQCDSQAVFCSEAVSRADRLGGGVDPVPNLADRDTEPGDLARSDFYRYQFTLEP